MIININKKQFNNLFENDEANKEIANVLFTNYIQKTVAAIEEGKIIIKEPKEEFIKELNETISKSGDDLRLSEADKKLLALALDLKCENENIKVLTDDYSMQNVLNILEIPYDSIITEGIKGVYNWVKTCEGCKKEFDADYPFDDCEICGSKVFKRRIKTY